MQKLVRTTLADQISDYIKAEISKGTWKPGDKLPSETELASMLGVSRMSLRNGIQRCNSLGITETRVGEGTFVKDFNMRSYFSELNRMNYLPSTPNEINDLRLIFQIGAVRLALTDQSFTDEDLQTLDQLDADMKQALEENNFEAFYQYDIMFHKTMCSLCKNPLLDSLYDALEYILDDITKKNVNKSLEHAKGPTHLLRYHNSLLTSIHNRDMDSYLYTIMESRKRSFDFYNDKTIANQND